MSKIKTAFRLLCNNRSLFLSAVLKTIPGIFNDKQYLSLQYKLRMGHNIDWESPQTFTEKIQWLKLYNRKPEYSQMVDKYAVKDYVRAIVGDKYIIPTLGVWDRVDEIDFDMLPDKFVLKTTHGGGGSGVIICKDKASLDIANVKKRLSKSMKQKIYEYNREWPYKYVKPRIIAEQLLEDSCNPSNLPDFKFYCFNGVPQYCQVIRDRSTKETIDFYDMEWNHMPFVGLNPVARNGLTPVARPSNLEDMKRVCRVLAKDIPFARVDLYEVNGREFFGEITFYPAGGFGTFTPNEWNSKLGELLKLEGISRGGDRKCSRWNCCIKEC